MKTNDSIPIHYHVISLTAAFIVGIDVALVSYLYTYLSIGIPGGLFIALAGFLLNAYVYFETGPASIQDLLNPKHEGILPRIIDLISILGAVFIGLFTVFAYQQMILQYAFLGIWFTPFFIFSMTAAYAIATFTLNKSGLLDLLNKGYDNISDCYDAFISELRLRCRFDDKTASWFTKCYDAALKIVLPLSVGLIVTIAYTSTFLMGALNLVTVMPQAWFLVPFVWVAGIAFFIGELYFNCEQNLQLVATAKDAEFNLTLASIIVLMVVIANAVANAFIAMDGPLMMMGLWGGLKFFSGGFQSFFTMSNKCIVQFESWEKITGGKPYKVLALSILVLGVISIVYVGFIFGLMNVLPWVTATAIYGFILYQMFINSSADTGFGGGFNSDTPSGSPSGSSPSGHLGSFSLGASPSYEDLLSEESADDPVSGNDEAKEGQGSHSDAEKNGLGLVF